MNFELELTAVGQSKGRQNGQVSNCALILKLIVIAVLAR
jgi:hypothetical protein